MKHCDNSMASVENILQPRDLLNIYLTSEGLKNQTRVLITSLDDFFKGDDSKITTFPIKKIAADQTVFEYTGNLSFNIERLDKFRNYLKSLSLAFVDFEKTYEFDVKTREGKPIKSIQKHLDFYITKDKKVLENLLEESKKKVVDELLEYSKEKIDRVFKKEDHFYRKPMVVSLAEAKNAGVEVPSWLAYVDFDPNPNDLVNNNISEEAKEVGKFLQDYVRKNNFSLSKKVEKEFKSQHLPYSWEQDFDGGYTLSYRY